MSFLRHISILSSKSNINLYISKHNRAYKIYLWKDSTWLKCASFLIDLTLSWKILRSDTHLRLDSTHFGTWFGQSKKFGAGMGLEPPHNGDITKSPFFMRRRALFGCRQT